MSEKNKKEQAYGQLSAQWVLGDNKGVTSSCDLSNHYCSCRGCCSCRSKLSCIPDNFSMSNIRWKMSRKLQFNICLNLQDEPFSAWLRGQS
jgi:hypothetical protein